MRGDCEPQEGQRVSRGELTPPSFLPFSPVKNPIDKACWRGGRRSAYLADRAARN